MGLSLIAPSAASVCFVAAILWAGVADLVTMKIRNELVIFLIAIFAILAPLSGLGWIDIGVSLAISAGVLTVSFVMFGLGWIGGGDAKLAAVITLWLGFEHAIPFVLYTALFGGVLTIALLQFRISTPPAAFLTVPWIARLHAPETGVPYGIAMAVAALVIFPGTHWMKLLA